MLLKAVVVGVNVDDDDDGIRTINNDNLSFAQDKHIQSRNSSVGCSIYLFFGLCFKNKRKMPILSISDGAFDADTSCLDIKICLAFEIPFY